MRSYTPEEALSLLVEIDLSRACYETMRQGSLEHNVDLYPSYNRVLETKDA